MFGQPVKTTGSKFLCANRPSQFSTRVANRPRTKFARKNVVMSLDPSKTAVVLIEFQNEFTTPGGKMHEAVKECMDKSGMLDNAVQTAKAAREKGALVVHCPITFTDDYKELAETPYGVLAGVKGAGAFKKSDWGSAICDPLKPEDADVIVEGKRGLDGFVSTNLDFILRNKGIQNIGLGGFLGNCCVESTMRTAYEKGYNVFTLKDCVASTSVEANDAAINFTYPMFSKPVTHDEFLDEISAFDP